ncbi:hypothetical protein [uncultured Jatrophihabitans sp.]|uniref:hypothetical protein n=1 Tax=uncultured Jatrophihabitans sp. TaxID=1610747 RepID=UPI0035CC74C1
MRRSVLRRVGLVVGVALALPASAASAVPATSAAGATSPPTLNGPTVARYYATVPVRGTTPQPSQAVEFYERHAGTATWSHRALRRSDASGRYATSFRETADTQYFVRSAGADSPTRTTKVVKATCSTSKAIFTKLPFGASPHPSATTGDFADVTAYRNGLWAGVIYRDVTGDFYVYTLRRGHPRTVLARYRYRDTAFDPFGSVHVVGVTTSSEVVANVESTSVHTTYLSEIPNYGVYWRGRTRHYLSHAAGWKEWGAQSVTDAGEIVGYAATGRLSHPHVYVVAWSRASAHYRVIADLGYSGAPGAADRAGDIAWTSAAGYATVRTASGAVHELRSAPLTSERYESRWIYITGAGLHTFYASSNDGVYAWTVSNSTAPGPIIDSGLVSGWDGGNTFVDIVGRRGDLVVDLDRPWLITARGARVRMPAELAPSNAPTRVITDGGRVAFTSARDHRVHIMTCR